MTVNGRKALIFEFLRYVLVGGIAFLVDFGTFALFRELLFGGAEGNVAITVSTAAGFVAGLAVNYILSMLIVFRTEKQQKQGKNARAVFIFFAVGLIGLGLTELLQWLGETRLLTTAFGKGLDKALFGYGKYAVKIVVAGIVLIWNYVGRKIFVFKGDDDNDKQS